jgi:NADH-quinone oxidoreductase subunit N
VLVLITVIAGNLLALRQRNVKRMLAFSSIAHAGYMAAALLVPTEGYFGGAAILFYLVSYSVVSLGAFGILTALKDDTKERFDVSSFYGLSSTHPFLSFAFTLFLLALAGLPPGMAGFLGKFYVFSSAISGGYIGLSIIAMIASAVSCYYYLRVVVAMYFIGAGNSDSVVSSDTSALHTSVVFVCLVLSVALGVFPEALFNYAQNIIVSL